MSNLPCCFPMTEKALDMYTAHCGSMKDKRGINQCSPHKVSLASPIQKVVHVALTMDYVSAIVLFYGQYKEYVQTVCTRPHLVISECGLGYMDTRNHNI